MSVGGRASKEVAEHFCKKYGCPQAGEIITARLSADSHPEKTKFWREVLDHLSYLQKHSPTCGIHAAPAPKKPAPQPQNMMQCADEKKSI